MAATMVPVEVWELALSYLGWPDWIAASATNRALNMAASSVRLWQHVGMNAAAECLRDVKLRLQRRCVARGVLHTHTHTHTAPVLRPRSHHACIVGS